MAETIVLRTELRDGATVLAQLNAIDVAAAKLSAKPISLGVELGRARKTIERFLK